MDSTSSMNDIFDFFIRVFTWIFEFLDSIQFWGISLLDFTITLFVIGAALPIIIALISTRPTSDDVANYRDYKNSSTNSKDEVK